MTRAHDDGEAPQSAVSLRAHELLSEDFGGPARPVAHLDTDAVAYQPGEVVHARAILLGAITRAPHAEFQVVRFALYGPDGELESEARTEGARVLASSLEVPESAAEGEHALVAEFASAKVPSARKVVQVRRRPSPRGPSPSLGARVTFHPESGVALGGVASRLYVEATRDAAPAAGLSGRIVDGAGTRVAEFVTDADGRARLTWTPHGEETWRVELDAPIEGPAELPPVAREGWALTARADSFEASGPVRVRVTVAGAARRGRVALAIREWEVASRDVSLEANEALEVELTPPSSAHGVLRLVAYDARGVACAERLVFRQPARSLQVEFVGRATSAGVEVAARVTDPDGEPVEALILAAADDAGGRPRREDFFATLRLDGEVRGATEAAWSLGADPAEARRLDLLLGVQSWRRFGFYRPGAFVREHGRDATRALGVARPVASTGIEGQLNQCIVDMNLALLEAKKGVALSIADEKRLGKQREQEQATAAEWGQKAELARQAGADDLAEEARQRLREHLQTAEELEAQWRVQVAAVEQLKVGLRASNHKLEAVKRRKNVLVARLMRVEAEAAIRATFAALNDGSGRDRLDLIEAQLRAREGALGIEPQVTAPECVEEDPERAYVHREKPDARGAPRPLQDPEDGAWRARRPPSSVALWTEGMTDARGHVTLQIARDAPGAPLRVRLDAVAEDGALGTAEIVVSEASPPTVSSR